MTTTDTSDLDELRPALLQLHKTLLDAQRIRYERENGRAILYADRMTESMSKAIGETERRRARQVIYNQVHGITARSIVKKVRDLIDGVYSEKASKEMEKQELQRAMTQDMSEKDIAREIKRLEKQMLEHARNLEFEKAAQARDRLGELRRTVFGASPEETARAVG